MIQILYMQEMREEFVSKINDRIHNEAVATFMSGLYWRNVNEINEKTIVEIEKLLYSLNETDIRQVILGLITISTKCNCAVNAYYIHEKLSSLNLYRRDYVLSFFLLKQYDQVKVVSDMCERAIALRSTAFCIR